MNPSEKIVIDTISTVRMMVSPLQWGEQPGNIRFTLFTESAHIPMGSVSIGGMAAYRMQKMILATGPVNARVIRGRSLNQFVLTHLEMSTGWVAWREAIYAPVAVSASAATSAPVELPASRRVAVSDRATVNDRGVKTAVIY